MTKLSPPKPRMSWLARLKELTPRDRDAFWLGILLMLPALVIDPLVMLNIVQTDIVVAYSLVGYSTTLGVLGLMVMLAAGLTIIVRSLQPRHTCEQCWFWRVRQAGDGRGLCLTSPEYATTERNAPACSHLKRKSEPIDLTYIHRHHAP